MELKYGHSKTYKYTLDDGKLEWLTDKTNRSKGQTKYLYQLVDGNFEKLKNLEMQLKNCMVGYCPADKEEVEKVMKMEQKLNLLKL